MSLDVLMTAASRRVPLVLALRRALAATGGGRVVVTDVNPLSPAVYAADRAYRVPLSSEPGYVDEIAAICRAERVGLVVPTIDDELTVFAEAAPALLVEGIRVAVSSPDTTRTCNDKFATCQVLTAHGVAAAASYLPDGLPADVRFPLFVKPRYGRGSIGAFAVQSARDLDFFLHYVPNPVFQDYLHGPEYTIDLFCDFDGQPLSIVPRERVVIRAGVIDRGRTVNDPSLIALAEACARAIHFLGPINIQCRVVDGRPVVFEINPRFSGGIPLTIEAGADFPRMLVQLTLGQTVAPSIGAFRHNLWMSSYESSVFVDDARVRLEPMRPVGARAEVA